MPEQFMAEKITREMTGVDESGHRYDIVEYVLTTTTTQLSDSHVAEERSPPRHRLTDGRVIKPLGNDMWLLEGRELKLRVG
ncbi:MAG: hypothetical protein EOP08_05405 [Proteobacteria bacterium]|nr:MAG: hypothetical protein EOP08_05405 [Pseudomonadota bacterium]